MQARDRQRTGLLRRRSRRWHWPARDGGGGLRSDYCALLESESFGLRDAFEPIRVRPTPWPSDPGKRNALRLSIGSLLQKKAVVPVPQSEQGQGFYSIIFLVPKHTGGFRLVLDLKVL
ncbi:hypothetical protein NDU88_009113 [Pleurodeles waltl]|uniref:Uncharacterized protein n=1 Tax=Pleurodeles waltl TaxID=8319 RepID=A0AAV7RYU0_PLEWA|nr:hypothetical protein NDU88_009113 [Pleurodeles waltl]